MITSMNMIMFTAKIANTSGKAERSNTALDASKISMTMTRKEKSSLAKISFWRPLL